MILLFGEPEAGARATCWKGGSSRLRRAHAAATAACAWSASRSLPPSPPPWFRGPRGEGRTAG